MAAPLDNSDPFTDVPLPAPLREFEGLNFPSIHPYNARTVTIYVRGGESGIKKGQGYWDVDSHTWKRADGIAIEILGWKKTNCSNAL
jgi:hypothetical protein